MYRRAGNEKGQEVEYLWSPAENIAPWNGGAAPARTEELLVSLKLWEPLVEGVRASKASTDDQFAPLPSFAGGALSQPHRELWFVRAHVTVRTAAANQKPPFSRSPSASCGSSGGASDDAARSQGEHVSNILRGFAPKGRARRRTTKRRDTQSDALYAQH